MRDAAAEGLPVADTEPDVFEQLLLWIYTGEVAEVALQGMLNNRGGPAVVVGKGVLVW